MATYTFYDTEITSFNRSWTSPEDEAVVWIMDPGNYISIDTSGITIENKVEIAVRVTSGSSIAISSTLGSFTVCEFIWRFLRKIFPSRVNILDKINTESNAVFIFKLYISEVDRLTRGRAYDLSAYFEIFEDSMSLVLLPERRMALIAARPVLETRADEGFNDKGSGGVKIP